MANNECSGPAVATFLARYIRNMKKRRYGYRFVFLPETIGSIAWLSENYDKKRLKENVVAGFVLNCIGDERTYSYVKTPYGNTITDKVLEITMKYYCENYTAYSFLERGSDERQYNSPNIELPVCSVCRSKFEKYPEYHTSADDLTVVTGEGLLQSYEYMKKVFIILENNYKYRLNTKCEPQLGKRGLYYSISEKKNYSSVVDLMNVLSYCDGKNDILDISELIGVDPITVVQIVQKLKEKQLIEKQI